MELNNLLSWINKIKGSVQSCVWSLEFNMKHVKKTQGRIDWNVNTTMKMKAIVCEYCKWQKKTK